VHEHFNLKVCREVGIGANIDNQSKSLSYNNTIVSNTSRIVTEQHYDLEHHLWSSIMLLELLIMLLELSFILLENIIRQALLVIC
jgi:hypothetical protein